MMFVDEWKSFDGMCCRMFNSRACYMAGVRLSMYAPPFHRVFGFS